MIFSYARIGITFVWCAMAAKACLGVTTLGMVTSVYLKIRIIYRQESAQTHEKYTRWINIAMAIVFLINLIGVVTYAVIFKQQF